MPSPSSTAPESSKPRLPERAANQQPLLLTSGRVMRYRLDEEEGGMMSKSWLPFVDKCGTLCLAPFPEVVSLFSGVSSLAPTG